MRRKDGGGDGGDGYIIVVVEEGAAISSLATSVNKLNSPHYCGHGWLRLAATSQPLTYLIMELCGKLLNKDLPPADRSPSDTLARNKHQILVHTCRQSCEISTSSAWGHTIVHRAGRAAPLLWFGEIQETFRRHKKQQQYSIKIKSYQNSEGETE